VVPPLRERGSDVALLLQHYLQESARAHRVEAPRMTPTALEILSAYRWPGNVRELKNVVERACMLAEGNLITERDIEASLGPATATGQTAQGRAFSPALSSVERGHIVDVLRQVSGNRMAAAKILGISRRALYRRLDRHGIADIS